MLRIAYYAATCGFLLALLCFAERPAYAYVDPGSGLFLLQGISGAFVGVLYFLRRRLKALMGSKDELSTGQVELSSGQVDQG